MHQLCLHIDLVSTALLHLHNDLISIIIFVVHCTEIMQQEVSDDFCPEYGNCLPINVTLFVSIPAPKLVSQNWPVFSIWRQRIRVSGKGRSYEAGQASSLTTQFKIQKYKNSKIQNEQEYKIQKYKNTKILKNDFRKRSVLWGRAGKQQWQPNDVFNSALWRLQEWSASDRARGNPLLSV